MILYLPAVVRPELLSPLAETDDAHLFTGLLCESLCANARFHRAVRPLRYGTAEVLLIDARSPPPEAAEGRPLALAAPGLRADVEVYCFLTDPESYAGGDLVVDTGYGDVARKGPAGSCVVCPTSSRRRLSPVSEGASRIARLVVQSCVRDEQQRLILYDLDSAADFFDLANMADPVLTLRRCHARLLNLWTEV